MLGLHIVQGKTKIFRQGPISERSGGDDSEYLKNLKPPNTCSRADSRIGIAGILDFPSLRGRSSPDRWDNGPYLSFALQIA